NQGQEARVLWPACGKHRLQMRLDDQRAEFAFRCPACNLEPNSYFAQASLFPAVAEIKTAKPLLNRFAIWMEAYLGKAITDGTVLCFRCSSPTFLTRELPPHAPK